VGFLGADGGICTLTVGLHGWLAGVLYPGFSFWLMCAISVAWDHYLHFGATLMVIADDICGYCCIIT
jgi:hypothetical protein